MRRRVAVTGVGVVSGYGIGTDLFIDSVFSGRSAVRRLSWDASLIGCQIGAEVTEYDASPYFREPKDARRFEATILHAVASSRLALDHARLVITDEIADRTATYFGSGIGGLDTLNEQITKTASSGINRYSPFFIVNSISNMSSGIVSIESGARGPSFNTVSACASSGHAIGEAMRLIQHGYA
ncbi:MAG: hypothetical protein M3R04_05595, partial [bacterium]|nr:hypothetical protein [bacterium]